MEINKYIDYTHLNNQSTLKDIEKLCNEALKYKFATVCVYPYYIPLVKELLKDSTIEVCTVIGYPHGCSTKQVKAYEAIDCIENGADEIEMFINISALKNKNYDYIKEEIEELRDSIDGKPLGIVIQTDLLTKEEIIKIIEICNSTFVNYIEIFTNSLVNIEDIELINNNKNELLNIKVSGQIDDYDTALKLIETGVNRIGTSNGTKIMEGGI